MSVHLANDHLKTNYHEKTILYFAAVLMATTVSQAEWKFGIGAGIGAFDIDGDGTLGANSGDIEYDSGDLESALYFTRICSKRCLDFRSTVFSMEVEADQTPEPGVTISDLNFKRLIWDLTAGYKLIEGDAWTITTFAGIRSVTHEMTSPALGVPILTIPGQMQS